MRPSDDTVRQVPDRLPMDSSYALAPCHMDDGSRPRMAQPVDDHRRKEPPFQR